MESKFKRGDLIRLRRDYLDNENHAGYGDLLNFGEVAQCMGTTINIYDQEMVVYFNERTGRYVDGWLASRFELVEEFVNVDELLELL